MIRKYLVALILALWAFSLSAAHIEYLNEDLKFKIFNKKSGDIINYYKVLPGEKLEAKLYGVDQISILTRILDPIKDKQYSLKFRNF